MEWVLLLGVACGGSAAPDASSDARATPDSSDPRDVGARDVGPEAAADSSLEDVGVQDAGTDVPEPFDAGFDAGPPGSPRTLRFWIWNVAGNAMHGGATDDGLIEAAVSSIRNRDADFVAFNELCRNQYVALQDALRAAGWPEGESFSRFAESLPASAGVCRGTAYGNAIFSRAPLGTASTLVLPSDGRREGRTMLCAPLRDAPHMRFCTAHISTSSDVGPDGLAANVRQLMAVEDRLDEYHAAGDTVVLAGDINAQPSYARLDRFYAPSLDTAVNGDNCGAFRELDDTDPVCPGYGERTVPSGEGPCGTGVKIDLIFARESTLVGPYEADSLSISEACGGACSDHRIVIGEARLFVRD